MPITNKIPEGVTEVDVIIAGGGTAGCALAGRLAAADPNLEILVIEGGEDNFNKTSILNPGRFHEHLVPSSKTLIFYTGNKTKELADREIIIPSGGVLGGGSSVNFMLYTRAQRADFDAIGLPGWSANDLLPCLKNLETFHGDTNNPEVHGYDGPVHISDSGFRLEKTMHDFLSAAEKKGYPTYLDLQNLDDANGFQIWWRYAGLDGRRSDAAHSYLHPLIQDGQHPNLHVVCESKIEKVLFDENKRACGVEYGPNPAYQSAAETHSPKVTIKARKLVVVSCGACGTPSVLERSGIGGAELLNKLDIPVVSDLPGVGHDYQDHNLMFYPYLTSLDKSETLDEILSGRRKKEEALAANDPMLVRWNTCDVAGKIRPTEEDVDALGPEFRAAWDRDFKDQPNRPLMLMSLLSSYLGDQSTVPAGQYMSVACYTAYPYSRGSIHIQGKDWATPPSFSTGFFTDKDDIDIKKQIWAYKKHREILRRTEMYRGELAVGHPRFPEGSKAACVNLLETGGLKGEIKDLEYSKEDDAAIEQFLRENIATTWHSLGGAQMGPRDQMGVLDEHLNVHGVTGLKCCDLSVLPENVAANTCNTAYVVGEKAAQIITKELGLTAGKIPRLDWEKIEKETPRPDSRADSVRN